MQVSSKESLNWLFGIYNTITGWFIPEHYLKGELNARRARVAVIGNLVGMVIGLLLIIELLHQQGRFTAAWFILLAFVCLLPINLFSLRMGSSYKFMGTVTVFIFLALLLTAAYSYGGGFSSTIHWLPAVPLTATFLVGRRLGFITALFAMAGAITLYALDASGHQFPYRMEREELLMIGPYVTVAAILFVAMLAETYEWANAESRRSLRVARRERTEVERALDEQKEQSLITLESIADGVITTNEHDQITYINPVAAILTGWETVDAMGHSLSEVFMVFDEYTHEPAGNFKQACLDNHYVAPKRNHILLSLDGREIIVEHHASLIQDKRGEVKGVVIVFHDVTVERELTAQLRYQATHDPLSDLINRHEFEHQLQTLVTQPRQGAKHVLCTLDISQFKIINDSCGHAAGDELIRQFSGILQDMARENDIVGRLGGDEFGILMPGIEVEGALKQVREFRERLSTYRFNWEDKSFVIAAAIGLVRVDGSSANVTDLMNDADAARQAAKERGRNRVHVFEQNDHELLKRRGELRWAAYLNGAIEQDRFILTRQTIAPLHFKEHGAHYEVLLRYRDDDDNIISAEDFLTAAERYDLITEIDRWVVKAIVDWFQAHPEDMANTHTASINLSGHSVTDSRFSQELMQQLHRLPGLSEKICFEITETTAIANLNRARKFILEMRALGCRFALDDFGKGMSSLAYLKSLPVDYLKIDGDFVKDMLSDPIDHALVEYVNQIAHVIGMKTIAEYAESDEIVERLKQMHVDFAQGYAIDRPVPFEEYLEHVV